MIDFTMSIAAKNKPFVVAIAPAIETPRRCAKRYPAMVVSIEIKQLRMSMSDSFDVMRYAVAGGIIMNATTKMAPAVSKDPTIVMLVSVINA